MHQKLLIYQKWTDSGIMGLKNSKVDEFISYFLSHGSYGWDQFTSVVRSKYKDVLEIIVAPLLQIDDPLIALNLAKRLDPRNKDERGLLSDFIRNEKLKRVNPALKEIFALRSSLLNSELRKRKSLPDDLIESLDRKNKIQSST